MLNGDAHHFEVEELRISGAVFKDGKAPILAKGAPESHQSL